MLRKLLIIIGVLIAFAVAVAVAGYYQFQQWYFNGSTLTNEQFAAERLPAEPSQFNPLNDTTWLFTVPRGASVRSIARALEQQQFVPHQRLAELGFRWFSDTPRVQAGVYTIRAGDSIADVWQRIAQGQQHLFSITFVEGSEFRQWQQQVAEHPYLQVNAPERSGSEWANILSGGEHSHIEGLLFPSTYHFYAQTEVGQIYRQAYAAMQQHLASLWTSRDRDVPLTTPYEALILASIVEKETGAAAERELVASVFVNRLRTGMRLQSDPTIIYGLGDRYRGVIYRSDINEHTPYNTYRINGLPPTPIAMPGRAAIAATLQPASSEYFYFVSRNDGTHVFSTNLTDHNRAVQRYQRNR